MPQPNLCIINLRDHWPMKTDWQNIWYGMALTALLSDPHPGALRAIRDLQKAQQVKEEASNEERLMGEIRSTRSRT